MKLEQRQPKCAKDDDTPNKSLDTSGVTSPFIKVVRFASVSIRSLNVSLEKNPRRAATEVGRTHGEQIKKQRNT